MNINWETITISILGSGFISAIVTSLINRSTQIKAIRESGLYSKRANVLDELMNRMERLDRVIGELISPLQFEVTSQAEKSRRDKVVDSFNSFVGFYKDNRHYLPKKLSDEIGIICNEYKQIFIDFLYKANPGKGEPKDLNEWPKLIKKYENDFTEKKENIAKEFRKIIGVK